MLDATTTHFRQKFSCFTGFYWVLPSFTEFYRVLLGFTGFYRVVVGIDRWPVLLMADKTKREWRRVATFLPSLGFFCADFLFSVFFSFFSIFFLFLSGPLRVLVGDH